MYEYMAEFKAVHVMQLPNSSQDAASRALWKAKFLILDIFGGIEGVQRTRRAFAIAPVNRPTVACQLSSCTPIGLNTGVMTRLTEASAESLMLSTTLPLNEKLFSAEEDADDDDHLPGAQHKDLSGAARSG